MIRYQTKLSLAVLGVLFASPVATAQEPAKAEFPVTERIESVILRDGVATEIDEPGQAGATQGKPVGIVTQKVEEKPYEPRKIQRPTTAIYKAHGTQLLTTDRTLQHNFGLSLAEADDALRAQLEIPAGEGVVIVAVAPDGLAHQAGLMANDVILSLRGASAKDVAGVQKELLGLTREAIPVRLVRQGKRTQLSVVGPEHGFPVEPTEYWIGVPVSPVDSTLRAHLPTLEAETGLIANDVVKDSPAERAGVKKNDILVALNGKPLKTSEGMIAIIQEAGASQTQPALLDILSGGKPHRLTVIPAKRKASTSYVTIQPSPVQWFRFNQQVGQTLGSAVALQPQTIASRQPREPVIVPGNDGKVEVPFLLSGTTVRVDPKAIVDPSLAPAASTVPGTADPARMKELIHLSIQAKRPEEESSSKLVRVEAQIKEMTIKLDQIRSILDGLKKTGDK